MGSDRIDIGKFNYSLTLRQLTTGRNTSGQVVETFEDAGKFLADVEELSASEKEVADKMVLLQRIKITTHYNPKITNVCRLLYHGEEYDIIGMVKKENMFLVLDCSKVFE